jgi:hypothetical protein
MSRVFVLILLASILTTACQAEATALPIPTSTPTYTVDQIIPTPRNDPLPLSTSISTLTQEPAPTIESTKTSIPQKTATPTITKTETATPNLDTWQDLPIIPEVDSNSTISEIYEKGLLLGNDPHAFSIFGDCQSEPQEFLGVFETDPVLIASLSSELRETVDNFEGSFNRESPTSQDGTTPGSLLWDQWHRGEYGCTFAETPVDCELRINNPSFVIIQIGTHFESRNTDYLRKIINQLIDAGVVPILATKADNRELDNRINRDMALLANEFDLPLWNFWASLSDLPNRGLYRRDDRPLQGAIYLTDDAKEIHSMTGLTMLNAVWRAATGN